MLLFSKSIAQLMIPPASLIILGIIGIFFWQKQWGKWLVLFSFVSLWLLSTSPVQHMLTTSLEHQYPAYHFNQTVPNNAAIVLLGAGRHEKSLDDQGQDTLNQTGMMRTVYASRLAKQSNTAVYVSGGRPLTGSVEAESSIMKRWLMIFGVDAKIIHEEPQAKTTWENALFIKQQLAATHIDTIILVTSAWHMPRAVWCFEQQGLKVIAAPTDYLSQQAAYDIRDFLPRWDKLADSGHILHEYLGLLWYRFIYTK